MNRITSFFVVLILVLVGGVIITVASLDVPAPAKPVEKVIPDDRFPR